MEKKYKTLQDYLNMTSQERNELWISFKEIEKILGTHLPVSAFKHRAWWSNQSDTSKRPQACAWISAGYTVDDVYQGCDDGWVRFRRIGSKIESNGASCEHNADMDWRGFQQLAQNRMSEYYGMPLSELSLEGVPKRFDLVSKDGEVVGDAKYLTLVHRKKLPPAKFMEIAGHVWLLENTLASRRFLVFGNQREVPEWWLKKYGAIVKTVEFYFLSNEGELEKLR